MRRTSQDAVFVVYGRRVKSSQYPAFRKRPASAKQPYKGNNDGKS